MATNYKSSLPIRSEKDGLDERVHVKIVDYTDPDSAGNQVEVSESLIHNRTHGQDPAGLKVQLRLSENGQVNGDGDYAVGTNTLPNSSGIIAHDRGATIDETSQNKRLTAVAGEDDSINLDIALHDGDGQKYDALNPLPTYNVESPGDELYEYNEHVDVVKTGTDIWEYTVPVGKKAVLDGIRISSSAQGNWQLEIEDAPAAGTFTTQDWFFNSTADRTNFEPMHRRLVVAAGVKIKITVTNDDQQTVSFYSTLVGLLQAV